MKKTIFAVIIMIMFILTLCACEENRTDQSLSLGTAPPKDIKQETTQQPDDTDTPTDTDEANKDGLDMEAVEALQEKITNGEELTQADIDLYEQATNEGHVFDKPQYQEGNESGDDASEAQLKQEQQEWNDKIGISIDKPHSGMVTGSQNVEMDGEKAAQRVVVSGVTTEDADWYIDNFTSSGMWTEQSQLYDNYGAADFENDLADATNGAMENALDMLSSKNNDYKYYKDKDGNLCEVVRTLDATNATYDITITVINSSK